MVLFVWILCAVIYKLTLHHLLLLCWKSCLVGFKGFGVLEGYIIAFRSVVGSFYSVKITWDEFLREEIRNLILFWLCVVMNT